MITLVHFIEFFKELLRVDSSFTLRRNCYVRLVTRGPGTLVNELSLFQALAERCAVVFHMAFCIFF
jgi:hypothetical protein